MTQMNGQYLYRAGQAYQVTAQLQKEHLGLSGCGPSVTGNVNNVAAAVEDSVGRPGSRHHARSGRHDARCLPS